MTSEIKNRSKKQEKTDNGFKKAEFINHTFTSDDKARYKRWAEENKGSIGDILDRLLDDGYSVSLKYDSYTEAIACFIQNRDEKNVNAGFILTGRSRSGSMALLAAVYRHYVVFEQEWPVRESRSNGMDDE